jgi:hypothetical protein
MLTEPATATGINTILFIVSSMHDNCESKQTLFYKYKFLDFDMRKFERWNQYSELSAALYIYKNITAFLNIKFPYSYVHLIYYHNVFTCLNVHIVSDV